MHDEVFCHANAGQWIYTVHRTCNAADSVAAVVEIRLRGILRHRYELARTALSSESLSECVRAECVTWIDRAESSLAQDGRLAPDARRPQCGGAPHGQRSCIGSYSLWVDAFGQLDEAELEAHELAAAGQPACRAVATKLERLRGIEKRRFLSYVADVGARARSLRKR